MKSKKNFISRLADKQFVKIENVEHDLYDENKTLATMQTCIRQACDLINMAKSNEDEAKVKPKVTKTSLKNGKTIKIN